MAQHYNLDTNNDAQPVLLPNALYTSASTSIHKPSTFASANGKICVQTIPATPCSRSHHHQQFARPAQNPVLFERPVAPPLLSMKVSPQPWGGLPATGYRSGSGLVRSGFASGIPWRPKFGKSGIWFLNISSTVSLRSSWTPVRGHVPSLSRTARTSM